MQDRQTREYGRRMKLTMMTLIVVLLAGCATAQAWHGVRERPMLETTTFGPSQTIYFH